MDMKLGGEVLELDTSLRVAYKVQGQHNKKAYGEVFANVPRLPLEEQIGILYTAYSVTHDGKPPLGKQEFFDAVLKEYGVVKMTKLLSDLVEGIMCAGMDETEKNEYMRELTEAMQDQAPSKRGGIFSRRERE